MRIVQNLGEADDVSHNFIEVLLMRDYIVQIIETGKKHKCVNFSPKSVASVGNMKIATHSIFPFIYDK